jgi:hypothetical protein
MLGRRSLNLDLTSLDPEIERTLRRNLRNSVEMGDNMHANENERNRGENVDHTRTLRDLFEPVATNSPSCIVQTITYRQSATVWTLGQHHPNAVLIWKCTERVMESQLHRRPSGRHLEKSETDSY